MKKQKANNIQNKKSKSVFLFVYWPYIFQIIDTVFFFNKKHKKTCKNAGLFNLKYFL